MSMLNHIKHKSWQSERLKICPITISDVVFVIELFNTDGWLKYIGDRNIQQIADAENFIQNTIQNENAALWTICSVSD